MYCTKCGTNTKVVDSRRKEHSVYRRRSCPKCNNVFTTMEKAVMMKITPEELTVKLQTRADKTKQAKKQTRENMNRLAEKRYLEQDNDTFEAWTLDDLI